MADVYGTIGSEQVELNNAATEATLRALLLATAGSVAKMQEIAKMAAKAGLDNDSIQEANEGLSSVGAKSYTLKNALQDTSNAFSVVTSKATSAFNSVASFTEKMTTGGAQASDMFSALSRLPFGLGLVATGFEKVAKFQENSLKSYQELAASGANFNGSLTDMRNAAFNSYMTMEQFTRVVKENSDVFSTMGGSVKAGVDQFIKIQSRINAPGSETAAILGNLGVSFEESGTMIASFMRSQGSMNKQGLQNTEQVTQSVAGYVKELSLLSELTGQSREAIQKKLDEENMEAQWQNFLASVSPEKAEKLRQNMEFTMVQGGKPAVDAMKALAMGFPPLTESSQLYAATQRAGMAAISQGVQRANDSTISSGRNLESNITGLARAITGGATDMDSLRTVLRASALSGDGFANTLKDSQALQNRFMENGKMLGEKEIARRLKEMYDRGEIGSTEAKTARDTAAEMLKLQQTIMNELLPIFKLMQPVLIDFFNWIKEHQPVLHKFGESLTSTVRYMLTHIETIKSVIEAIALTTLAFKGLQAMLVAKELSDKLKGVTPGGAGTIGMPGGPGYSPTTAIWVRIASGAVPGSTGTTIETPEEKKNKGLNARRSAGMGVGAIATGIAGGMAEDSGHDTTGKWLNAASEGLTAAALAGPLAAALAPATLGLSIPVVEAVAGTLGFAHGIYRNFWGSDKPPEGKAAGGIVNPGSYLVGEKGPEVLNIGASGNIITNENMSTMIARSIERDNKITNALETLNNTMAEVKRHMAATSDNTGRTISEIRSLNPDRMPRP